MYNETDVYIEKLNTYCIIKNCYANIKFEDQVQYQFYQDILTLAAQIGYTGLWGLGGGWGGGIYKKKLLLCCWLFCFLGVFFCTSCNLVSIYSISNSLQ